MKVTPQSILRYLKEQTNEVLRDCVKAKSDIGGPVNWSDLRCTDADIVIHSDGSHTLLVEIEEAGPEATALRDAVQGGLMLRGWKGVDVETRLRWWLRW